MLSMLLAPPVDAIRLATHSLISIIHCTAPSSSPPAFPPHHQQSLDYPPVGAITLAYPESALRADRLDANGNLPGRQRLATGSHSLSLALVCLYAWALELPHTGCNA